MYPVTFGEPSAFQERLTVWDGAATPVPLRVAVDGEFEALLTNETLVEAIPLDSGVNVTVNDRLCPADKLTGNESPPMENSELPTSTDDTTTFAPVEVKVPVFDPLVPTVTFPTLILDGLTFSCPEEALIAEPLKATLRLEFEAFEEIATFPVKLPVDCGAKITVNDVVCPGASVIGVLTPDTLKPVPLAAICAIDAFAPPVF